MGLRGDPFLWRELKDHFSNTTLPKNSIELNEIIEKAIERIIKKPLQQNEFIKVDKFSYGSMSIQSRKLVMITVPYFGVQTNLETLSIQAPIQVS